MIGDLVKLIGSSEAEGLISRVKRLMDGKQLTIGEMTQHLDRLERLSQKTGKSIKVVSDEALGLYEKSL